MTFPFSTTFSRRCSTNTMTAFTSWTRIVVSFAGMPRRSGSRATLRPKSWAASVTITSAEMEGQAVDQLIRPSHRVDSGGEQPCEPVRGRYMGQAHRAGAQRGRQHV